MQPIIDPIPTELLLSELTKERFVRPTVMAAREIYLINGNDCPHTIREIGRLREWSFREGGGGSGKDCDLDQYDTGPLAYDQIVLWDPEKLQIIGGYRAVKCIKNRDEHGVYHLSTSEIVEYSDQLKNEIFPFTVELGRSFIQPDYQAASSDRRNAFTLDNLWDGLGALQVRDPSVRYYFGKITMYTNYNTKARDILLAFMHHYFPDNEKLVKIPYPIEEVYDTHRFQDKLKGLAHKEGLALTIRLIRSLGESIPPLFNAYMNLSPTMRTLGTSINQHFGGVEETGILLTVADIYPEKMERYTKPYIDQLAKEASA
jgi:Acetyltransferase (GNAT) domain